MVGGPQGTNHVTSVERQLAVAQQITHIGSWEWDLATGCVTWSDELYRIYGLEPHAVEITVDFFVSRLHPSDRERIRGEIAAALGGDGRFQWHERIVRPDAAVRTLHTVGEVLRDPAGNRTGLVGTCRDVTEDQRKNEQLRLHADIVHNVQIGLSVWSVGDAEDGLPRLVAFNPASERIARVPLGPFVGKTVRDIAPYAAGGELESLLARTAHDQRVHEASVDRSGDPGNPVRALAMKGFPLPGGATGIAIEDVTEATIERRLRLAEHHVLEMVAAGAALGDSLAALVLAIEEHSPPVIGSVLLLDADGIHLRDGAAPHVPEAHWRAAVGAEIGPRAGSCGTAAFRKRPVFVADIATDPLWDGYREIALAEGLRACWSIPILATDERVLGTFAFYHRAPHAPAPRDVELAARASRLAAIAIERKQLEEQLRDLPAHIESALEDERSNIAREIHDDLGQSLTALKMDIAWIQRRASSACNALAPETLGEKLRCMSALADDVIQRVRRISSELRPGVLDDVGLVAAIEWQAQQFEERTGTPCVIRSNAAQTAIDRHVSTMAYRIFQEALTNVVRHARATRVEVRVDVTSEALLLEVADDGVGISREAAGSRKALGLAGMRERAQRHGGSVTIGPNVQRGTLLSLRVPFQVEAVAR